MTVLRPRKDGGTSECSAPDDLVGKGRCCHVPGGSIKMNVVRVQRGMYEVNMDDAKVDIQADKDNIVKFFETLPKLDQDTIKDIISKLENE